MAALDEEILLELLSTSSEQSVDVSECSWMEDLSSSSSSSSSSEAGANRETHEKVQDFARTVQNYSDIDFKAHFRLTRLTAVVLIERYKTCDFYLSIMVRGRKKLGAEKEIYIFLWYMANTNTFRELGNLFGISKSTAWCVVKRVSSWLVSIGHEFVKWPDEATRNAIIFERTKNIPGVLGCINGSHIKIKAPVVNRESYFNRNRYYSFCLQGVVNSEKKFIDVFCGEPGSLHDSRVLRRSALYERAIQNERVAFPSNTFLLGDSAYPYLNWLIPPFKDTGCFDNTQRQFNKLHSSARVIVEHAFGLLKTRFRRLLHFTEQTSLNMIVNVIVCRCILHNICIDNNDIIEYDAEAVDHALLGNFGEESSDITTLANVTRRRQQLINELITRGVINTN